MSNYAIDIIRNDIILLMSFTFVSFVHSITQDEKMQLVVELYERISYHKIDIVISNILTHKESYIRLREKERRGRMGDRERDRVKRYRDGEKLKEK